MNSQLINDLSICNVAVFAKSEAGQYLFANDFAADMLNTTVGSLVGKNDLAFFDQASARLMIERDRNIRHSRLAAKYESVAMSGSQWHLYHSLKAPVQLNNQSCLLGLSVQVSKPNWNNGAKLIAALTPQINSGLLKLDDLINHLSIRGVNLKVEPNLPYHSEH